MTTVTGAGQRGDRMTLIERVRAATGPDRELDELLLKHFDPKDYGRLERIFKRKHEEAIANGLMNREAACRQYAFGDCPLFTASIDAALALCEQARPGWVWNIAKIDGVPSRAPMKDCEAQLWIPATRSQGLKVERAHSDGNTPALAILAALIASLEDHDNA